MPNIEKSNGEINLTDGTWGIMLIDMQVGYVRGWRSNERDRLVESQVDVLGYATKNNLLVYAIMMKERGEYISEIKSALEKVPRVIPFVKVNRQANAFAEENSYMLEDTIRQAELKGLLMMGINARLCVWATAIHVDNIGLRVATAHQLIGNTPMIYNHKDLTPIIEWFKQRNGYVPDYKTLIGLNPET